MINKDIDSIESIFSKAKKPVQVRSKLGKLFTQMREAGDEEVTKEKYTAEKKEKDEYKKRKEEYNKYWDDKAKERSIEWDRSKSKDVLSDSQVIRSILEAQDTIAREGKESASYIYHHAINGAGDKGSAVLNALKYSYVNNWNIDDAVDVSKKIGSLFDEEFPLSATGNIMGTAEALVNEKKNQRDVGQPSKFESMAAFKDYLVSVPSDKIDFSKPVKIGNEEFDSLLDAKDDLNEFTNGVNFNKETKKYTPVVPYTDVPETKMDDVIQKKILQTLGFNIVSGTEDRFTPVYERTVNGNKQVIKREFGGASWGFLDKTGDTRFENFADLTEHLKKPNTPNLSKDEAKAISTTILQQLGGNKFKAMTGADKFAFDTDGSLSFHLPNAKEAKGVKYVKIQYNQESDDYTAKYMDRSATVVKETPGLQADNLATSFVVTTGLATHL